MRIVAVENLLFHDFGNEGIILNMNTETYFGMNAVGMRMWQVVTTSETVELACGILQDLYNVPGDQLEADLNEFIDKLKRARLIEIHDD